MAKYPACEYWKDPYNLASIYLTDHRVAALNRFTAESRDDSIRYLNLLVDCLEAANPPATFLNSFQSKVLSRQGHYELLPWRILLKIEIRSVLNVYSRGAQWESKAVSSDDCHTCSICLEKMSPPSPDMLRMSSISSAIKKNEQPTVALPCPTRHTFHYQSIILWLGRRDSKSCHFCRHELTKELFSEVLGGGGRRRDLEMYNPWWCWIDWQ